MSFSRATRNGVPINKPLDGPCSNCESTSWVAKNKDYCTSCEKEWWRTWTATVSNTYNPLQDTADQVMKEYGK